MVVGMNFSEWRKGNMRGVGGVGWGGVDCSKQKTKKKNRGEGSDLPCVNFWKKFTKPQLKLLKILKISSLCKNYKYF